MSKSIVIAAILILALTLSAFSADEGSITITTYYPSPYGVYNALQTNKLAVGDTNGDEKLDSGDQPPQAGQIQVARSVVFTPQNILSLSDTREGEIAYDSASKSLRFYDGTAWKAVGGACYTNYCYNRGPYGGSNYQYISYGAPVCPEIVTIDTQGPCDNGFTVRKALGAWGYCFNNQNNQSYFLPPGGTCGPAALGYNNGFSNRIGLAFLCCQ